jgi:hypothetical protein
MGNLIKRKTAVDTNDTNITYKEYPIETCLCPNLREIEKAQMHSVETYCKKNSIRSEK